MLGPETGFSGGFREGKKQKFEQVKRDFKTRENVKGDL